MIYSDSSLSGYNPLARPEAHPPKRREPEMSHEQLEMLRRNRENHYGKMDPMDRPIARKPPIEKPREQPFRPPPPRIQQDQRPPSKPLPLPRSVPPSYNPLAASKMPQKPQRLPENYNPVRQPVAPVQRPANPEVDLVRGLANLRNTVPEYESRREHQHNPTIQRAQNVQNAPPAPKQRRINPKDDPNNAYCFRCQEWHRKDLHLGPTPQIQSRKPATHSGMVQSRSSQLSDRQLASQKADLAKAIFEMPPEIKKKPRKEVNLHPRFAFEEEDDFDYDDDFLASDDDEGMNYKKYLRKVTRYNPEAYDDADFDDRDMEVRDFEEIEREDRRSRAIGTKTFTQETMKTILRRWRNRMNALERIIDRENS